MPRIVVETAWEAGTSQTLLTVVEAAELGETLVPGRVPSTPIRHDSEPEIVEGGLPAIAVDGGVTVDDATVIQADLEAGTPSIHIIDRGPIPAA